MSCVARHFEKLAFVFVCIVVLCVLVIVLLFDICLRCSFMYPPSVIVIAAQATLPTSRATLCSHGAYQR